MGSRPRSMQFSVSRPPVPSSPDHNMGTPPLSCVHSIKNWLQTHEEAQVLLATILVIGGMWWLLRTVIAVFFSLVCPAAVILMIIMLVPQLRSVFLGEQYPKVAKLLRTFLLTLADRIKT